MHLRELVRELNNRPLQRRDGGLRCWAAAI